MYNFKYVDFTSSLDYNEHSNNNVVIANLNPFRYRGYYYDTETGLYYLNSRCYDPQIGRFINADNIENSEANDINGLNLYLYCSNNPVNCIDESGNSWFRKFWNSTIGKIVGTVVVVAVALALTVATAGVTGAVTAALGGGFWAATIGGAIGGAVSGAIYGAGFSIAAQGITNGYSNINWGKVGLDTLVGAGTGAAMGALFAAGGRALGLLGKTQWAQRPIDFNKSTNMMFGSESGNFTFLRIGKTFRLEASIQHGIHMHYQSIVNGITTVGRSVPRTQLLTTLWNSIVGVFSSLFRQLS